MNNFKLVLKIILGASISTVLVIFIILLVSSNIETDKNYYSTYSDAKDDRLFRRGWIPSFIPINSKEITEVHEIDSNEVCAKFSIPNYEVDNFLKTIKRNGFNQIYDTYEGPPSFDMFSIKKCPFSKIDIIKSKHVVYSRAEKEILYVTNNRSGRHNTYFALDKSSGTVYYWSLPKRI